MSLNYQGLSRNIFKTGLDACVGAMLPCFACFHTYSDGQLTFAGAQQSVHGAVEQLVIMEADVAGVGANHHGVFLRQQLQVARHFLLRNR